jgi:hypothetical protein
MVFALTSRLKNMNKSFLANPIRFFSACMVISVGLRAEESTQQLIDLETRGYSRDETKVEHNQHQELDFLDTHRILFESYGCPIFALQISFKPQRSDR